MNHRKTAAPLWSLSLACALFGASAARAGDAGQGEMAFRQSCSNCHTAIQAKKDQRTKPTIAAFANPHMGPDLALIAQHKGAEYVRKWVKNPWALRPATACDPRLLKKTQLEDVLTFLASRSRPEPERKRRSPMFRKKEQ